MSMQRFSSSLGRLALAAVAVLALGVATADARVGGGLSTGSRGGRTFTAPPSTNTAPRPTQPMQRSMTQPGTPSAAAQAARPAAAGSRFSGGFGSMLMGGLIGAGLFGLLSGHGLFGGLTGLASMLGLLLQVGLIALIGSWIWSYFRGRQPAMAGAGAGYGSALGRQGLDGQYRASNGLGGGSAGGSVTIGKDDFDAFERLLGQIQDAYGREDLAGLRRLTTPEMMSFLAEDISVNAKNGVRNELKDAKLLQGDLAESWREADAEYATVAMRFELIDTMVDRASGRVVSGNANVAQEATEVWTFKRRPGGSPADWQLSAIQQTG